MAGAFRLALGSGPVNNDDGLVTTEATRTHMAQVIRLADRRKRGAPVYFNRSELNALLAVYSRQVAKGEWRDYGIAHDIGMARFSVHRHTHESPQFTLVKMAPKGPNAKPEYVLFAGETRLRRGTSLLDVLSVFDKPLRLISP